MLGIQLHHMTSEFQWTLRELRLDLSCPRISWSQRQPPAWHSDSKVNKHPHLMNDITPNVVPGSWPLIVGVQTIWNGSHGWFWAAEVVVTTKDGLWRYQLNDTVEVAGFILEREIPLIRYVERKGYVERFLLLVLKSLILIYIGIPRRWRIFHRILPSGNYRFIDWWLHWLDDRVYHRARREEQVTGLWIFGRARWEHWYGSSSTNNPTCALTWFISQDETPLKLSSSSKRSRRLTLPELFLPFGVFSSFHYLSWNQGNHPVLFTTDISHRIHLRHLRHFQV